METIISASILNADMSNLGQEIKRAEENGADMIHLDIMDGVFVRCITFGDNVVRSLRGHCNLKFDTHLMVHNPLKLIPLFAGAGSDIITVHVESEGDTMEAINLIKGLGLKSGVSLSPNTPVEAVLPYITEVSMILVMTVNPGAGGQGFIESMTEKIRIIREKADELGISLDIEVDGGINKETALVVKRAGANVLVAGTYLFGSADMADAVKSLR